MSSKIATGPRQTQLPQSTTATRSFFDFEISERPIYKPKSGPPLIPISIMPPDDLDGIILDKCPYPRKKCPPAYIVGFKGRPNVQIVVQLDNILDYVSRRTHEDWELEQFTIQQQEAEQEAQQNPKKRQLRSSSRESLEDNDEEEEGRASKKLRGNSPEKPHKKVGRPRKVVKQAVPVHPPVSTHNRRLSQNNVSLSQISQQPSLSTPRRPEGALSIDSSILSEGEEEDNDAVALDRQLNGDSTKSPSSSSSSSSGARLRSASTMVSGSSSGNPKTQVNSAPHLPPLTAGGLQTGFSSTPEYHSPYPPILNTEEKTTANIRARSSGSIDNSRRRMNFTSDGEEEFNRKAEADAAQVPKSRKRRNLDALENDSQAKRSRSIRSTRSKTNNSLLSAINTDASDVEVVFNNGSLGSSKKEPSIRQRYSNMTKKPSIFSPAKRPESSSSAMVIQDSNGAEEPNIENGVEPGAEPEEEEPVWTVKAIVGEKKVVKGGKKKTTYLIDWEGDYPQSWEPAENVGKEAIDEWKGKSKAEKMAARYLGIESAGSLNSRRKSRRSKKGKEASREDDGDVTSEHRVSGEGKEVMRGNDGDGTSGYGASGESIIDSDPDTLFVGRSDNLEDEKEQPNGGHSGLFGSEEGDLDSIARTDPMEWDVV